MRFNKQKIISLSLLMMLSTSLTAYAEGQSKKTQHNKSSKYFEKKSRTSNQTVTSRQDKMVSPFVQAANAVCNIDDNGQDWPKLQSQLKAQLHNLGKSKDSPFYQTAKNRQQKSTQVSFNGNGVDGRYYIPVVFHVYGEQFTCDDEAKSCLTDAKITDALARLNEDFLGTNTQDGPISAQFQAIRENLNIEFVLAKKSPDGQTTSGIVRYSREQAGYGNGSGADTLIANDAWNNFKYMNVYVMNDLYDDGSTNNSGVAVP